jgi:hypothetical protein
MVYWKKYTNYVLRHVEDYNSGINFRVVRLADIYLLYAEATEQLNRTSEAYDISIKSVAAWECPTLKIPQYLQVSVTIRKINDRLCSKRTCELGGESTRWFDLERWGMFENPADVAWLKNRDADFNNFVIGINQRFPIPYREIALVPIEQNYGY